VGREITRYVSVFRELAQSLRRSPVGAIPVATFAARSLGEPLE
jgi:hypothetical protein